MQDDGVLKITMDTVFSLVMQDEEICTGLLEMILPGEGFDEVLEIQSSDFIVFDEADDLKVSDKVVKNTDLSVETQKTIQRLPDTKGVRLDLVASRTNVHANVEMQNLKEKHHAKRSRYYRAMSDVQNLKRGDDYFDLPKLFIIFICSFDMFDLGKPYYVFTTHDTENDLPLNDETSIIPSLTVKRVKKGRNPSNSAGFGLFVFLR